MSIPVIQPPLRAHRPIRVGRLNNLIAGNQVDLSLRPGSNVSPRPQSAVVDAYNAGPGDMDCGYAVRISGQANPVGFNPQGQPIFLQVGERDFGPIAIALDFIPAGRSGRVAIPGAAWVQCVGTGTVTVTCHGTVASEVCTVSGIATVTGDMTLTGVASGTFSATGVDDGALAVTFTGTATLSGSVILTVVGTGGSFSVLISDAQAKLTGVMGAINIVNTGGFPVISASDHWALILLSSEMASITSNWLFLDGS